MDLSLLWMLPFAAILLCIALFPLIHPHFWERNLWWITLFVFALPMLIALEFLLGPDLQHMAHEKALEYVSFILLLASLYIISGGIHVGGTLTGTPSQNAFFLFTGSLIASLIGTTGASMLLIRPLLRANRDREKKVHTVVFFIFLVSNIGGILTPLGDPPLFLGYLQGVPFEWTLNLFPHFAFAGGAVLLIYYLYDNYLYNHERNRSLHAQARRTNEVFVSLQSVKHELDAALSELDLSEREREHKVSVGLLHDLQEKIAFASNELDRVLSEQLPGEKQPVRFRGKWNFFLLAGVVTSIYMQGYLTKRFAIWPHFGPQELAMIVLAFLSLRITPMNSPEREENGFSFAPIKEVAYLFAAIFATMIPALFILEHRGAELSIREPWQFFWAAGGLSSFLDNAPTYLTFLSLAKSLGLPNDLGFFLHDGGSVTKEILTAISVGSVFMGANTYIGNGPNFMVRSIAESHGVKMPSFFGYMAYSMAVLVPVFVIATFLFFV